MYFDAVECISGNKIEFIDAVSDFYLGYKVSPLVLKEQPPFWEEQSIENWKELLEKINGKGWLILSLFVLFAKLSAFLCHAIFLSLNIILQKKLRDKSRSVIVIQCH